MDSLNSDLSPIVSRNRTIESFNGEEIPSYFRFRGKGQLYQLLNGFEFPDFLYTKSRHKFSGEEVLLIGLYRLSHVGRLHCGSFVEIFGFAYHRVSKIFLVFLDFMVDNWRYIIRDNISFWLPYLHHLVYGCNSIY